MDVARVNFSHGPAAEHRATVAGVRLAAAAMGRHIALLQDLQGPKIRIGRLHSPPVHLRRGGLVTLTSRSLVGDPTTLPVSHSALIRSLVPEERVLLADAEIALAVRAVSGAEATFVVR